MKKNRITWSVDPEKASPIVRKPKVQIENLFAPLAGLKSGIVTGLGFALYCISGISHRDLSFCTYGFTLEPLDAYSLSHKRTIQKINLLFPYKINNLSILQLQSEKYSFSVIIPSGCITSLNILAFRPTCQCFGFNFYHV